MPSLSSQWDKVVNAAKDSHSYDSPGTAFSLMFDPNAYLGDLFGVGDDYRKLINKSGYYINKGLSKSVEPVASFSRKNNPLRKEFKALDSTQDWAENKPGSVLGMAIGGYNLAGLGGGGAAGSGAGSGSAGTGSQLGGLGGWGGGTNSGLGIFSNGGQGGLAGVGGGNAGMFAANGGIAGGAGMGSATSTGGAFNWQEMAQQGMQNMQQPQQQQASSEPEYRASPTNPAYLQANVTQGQPITYQQRLARVLQYA